MDVKKSTIASGDELLDFLLPQESLRHLEIALFDGSHRDVHARTTHVRIRTEVMEIVTHWHQLANRTLGVIVRRTEHGHRRPDEPLGAESCLHVPRRIFQVMRVGGGTAKEDYSLITHITENYWKILPGSLPFRFQLNLFFEGEVVLSSFKVGGIGSYRGITQFPEWG